MFYFISFVYAKASENSLNSKLSVTLPKETLILELKKISSNGNPYIYIPGKAGYMLLNVVVIKFDDNSGLYSTGIGSSNYNDRLNVQWIAFLNKNCTEDIDAFLLWVKV